MVHFNNGNNNSTYVSLTTPPSNENNIPTVKTKNKGASYDNFNMRTRCKGDVLFLKVIVVVLVMVVVWLVYASYAQQKAIQTLHLSKMSIGIPRKAAIKGNKDTDQPKYTCKLTVGRGISTSKIDMNYLLGTDCIKACAHMKKEDAQINGVIVFSNKNRNGCWCTRNMTQIVDRYKTCFLKPNTSTTDTSSSHIKPTPPPTKNVTCQFGDGVGGSEFRMGNLKGPECIATCQHLRAIDQTINGVTLYANTSKGGCWCKQRMTRVRVSRLFQTCKLSAAIGISSSASKKNHICDFTFGNGAGGSELKVGYQKGNDCINACAHMKDLDPTINGVTMYNNPKHVGCWCEKDMKIVDGTFKSCFLEPV